MQAWEYDVFPWNENTGWSGARGVVGVKAMLEAKGNDGWELVTVSADVATMAYYFKRPRT